MDYLVGVPFPERPLAAELASQLPLQDLFQVVLFQEERSTLNAEAGKPSLQFLSLLQILSVAYYRMPYLVCGYHACTTSSGYTGKPALRDGHALKSA